MSKLFGHSKIITVAERRRRRSKNVSEGMRKWHAEMSKEKKIKLNRKKSKSVMERQAQIPLRAKRDTSKKKSDSIKKYFSTILGDDGRYYAGYLGSRTLFECGEKRRSHIIQKRRNGALKFWSKLTPEERAEKVSYKNSERGRGRRFYEKDVPRKNTYCGVITESELESLGSMNG